MAIPSTSDGLSKAWNALYAHRYGVSYFVKEGSRYVVHKRSESGGHSWSTEDVGSPMLFLQRELLRREEKYYVFENNDRTYYIKSIDIEAIK